jgi:septal ring factor EnvC (AmiA/AmiB activator)
MSPSELQTGAVDVIHAGILMSECWFADAQAIGREVRTLVVGIQDKLQAQLAKVESQNTQVEAQVSSLKTEVEAVRSDMRELKDMLARLLDNNPAATKPGGTTEEQVKELK